MELDIIYEDDDIIVCYKPAGIATETRRVGQQDAVNILRNYRARKKEPSYIGMVHRLDQPVEGLLVFGKTPAAAAELSAQVQKRSIGKHYYAVGVSTLPNAQLIKGRRETLTDYLLFDKRANHSCVVEGGNHQKQAKKSMLDYEIVDCRQQRVCLDITLHTGRHHQIRVQMAHHGLPLLGDHKYGTQETVAEGRPLALCAYRLEFVHPGTGKVCDFVIAPRNPAFDQFDLDR